MTTPVRRAIYGKLTSAGDLLAMLGPSASGYTQSIYHDQAPADAGFPFIVFGKSSGVPTEAFGDPSALETDIWLIKAVARNDEALGESVSDRVEKIADRIKTLLNDAKFSISGIPDDPVSGLPLQPLYLRRQSDVEYPELADGVLYRHAGSLYRVVTTHNP